MEPKEEAHHYLEMLLQLQMRVCRFVALTKRKDGAPCAEF
jgi:hypothetical protein